MPPAFLSGTDAEIASFAETLAHGFGFPREDAPRWLAKAGHDNVRLLTRDGDVLGGLVRIPMGHVFGGRSVPTVGVAGVAVRPDVRGQGLARELMLGLLREARAAGVALSSLYPATLALYRQVGYERAGARHRIRTDPRALHLPRVPELTVRQVDGCPPEVRAFYMETVTDGQLDRGPYVWARVEAPRGKETKTFTFSSESGLEAYAVLSHKTEDGDGTTLEIVDVAARTPRGARAVLRHCAEYRSLAKELVWHGGTSDLLVEALPELHATITLLDTFLIRVVCPEAALEARGYPRHVEGTLAFDLDDGSLPEASGTYEVRVSGGRAEVKRLGAGESTAAPRVGTSERGLASLFAGYHTRRALTDLGWIAPSSAAEPLVDALFAGPVPSMRDMF